MPLSPSLVFWSRCRILEDQWQCSSVFISESCSLVRRAKYEQFMVQVQTHAEILLHEQVPGSPGNVLVAESWLLSRVHGRAGCHHMFCTLLSLTHGVLGVGDAWGMQV